MQEKIFDIYWEGPYKWDKREQFLKKEHVLYAIFGVHPVYGHNSLLYIGRTKVIKNRLTCHDEDWINEEYDVVKVRVASMGEIDTWKGWDKTERYTKAKVKDVIAVESLLIYANQPAYNQKNKYSTNGSKNIRIFNTGMVGTLLKEVSYIYHIDDNW